MQALVSVPNLRDAYTQPKEGTQLKKGAIGNALEELIQTVYGACKFGNLAQSWEKPTVASPLSSASCDDIDRFWWTLVQLCCVSGA